MSDHLRRNFRLFECTLEPLSEASSPHEGLLVDAGSAERLEGSQTCDGCDRVAVQRTDLRHGAGLVVVRGVEYLHELALTRYGRQGKPPADDLAKRA